MLDSLPPLSPDERADSGTLPPGDLAEAITPLDKAPSPDPDLIGERILGRLKTQERPNPLPVN